MALSRHQRYEIIFLSEYPLGPKFGHNFVMKAVKRRISTVQYWLGLIDGNSQKFPTIQLEHV